MRRFFSEFLYAVAISAIVFAVTCVSAWLSMRCGSERFRHQFNTRRTLHLYAKDVQEFFTEHRVLPESLLQIEKPRAMGRTIKDGRVIDDWNHEIQYQPGKSGSFELYSFGRDGVIGGVGLDADLNHDGREGSAACVRFKEFFFPKSSDDVRQGPDLMMISAIVVAFLTFASILLSCRRQRAGQKKQFARIIMEHLANVVIAIVVGAFLMVLYAYPRH